MNIFENYLKEIENLVHKNKSHLSLKNLNNLKNVSLEIPLSNLILTYLVILRWF